MSRFRSLPPMAMLTTFECASRKLNIRKTAIELGVTSSAVSLQLKNLEDYLGIKLFNRSNDGLSITIEGRAYFETVREAFEVILKGVSDSPEKNKTEEINIVVPRNFSLSLLKDALMTFEKDNPDIKVKTRVIPEHQTQQGINFNNNNYDGAVLWGNGVWTNMDIVLLYKSKLGIFGSSKVFKNVPLKNYSDIQDYPWLISWSFPMQWVWATRFLGIPEVRTKHREIFVTCYEDWMNYIADGKGVGISEKNMLKYHDVDGIFTNLIDKSIPGYDFFLVCPKNRQAREPFIIFKNWLKSYSEKNWLDNIDIGVSDVC